MYVVADVNISTSGDSKLALIAFRRARIMSLALAIYLGSSSLRPCIITKKEVALTAISLNSRIQKPPKTPANALQHKRQ
jgi:hypothetical protein